MDNLKKVKDVNGNEIFLDKVLGQGGQGIVYRSKDKNLAIKFLAKNDEIVCNEKIYKSFEDKVSDVSIMRFDEDIHICKPEIMLEKPICGYVMKLLNGLESIDSLIYSPNIDEEDFDKYFSKTGGLKKRLEVLIELARTLARIHSKGIVYCDLSHNNVFYAKGDFFSKVWLIDCDNLKFTYEAKKTIYTPGYGAPEIAYNLSQNTIFSDCYSFAVLAFKILTSRDPFSNESSEDSSSDGWDKTTLDSGNKEIFSQEKWLGNNDEVKSSYLKHFLTKDLFELFDATFNEQGIKVPFTRPSMRKWYQELKRTYVRITKCTCGQSVYLFEDKCPFCNESVKKNCILSLYSLNNSINVVIDDEISKFNNSMYYDENIVIDDETKQEFYNTLSKEKIFDTIIYDGFNIYDYNYSDISIDSEPKSILSFSVIDDSITVKNKMVFEFAYKTKRMRIYRKLPEELKINRGDKLFIVQLNKKNEAVKVLRLNYEE